MESCSSEKPIIPMEELAEEEAVSVLLADSVVVDNNNNNNTFGSMNMDDFLTNIWTTEESNQNIPATGVRKSQEEVWSDMHTVQQQQQQQPCQFTPVDAPRQPNFEEMTLEAFLVKAGVVRDDPKCNPTGDGRAMRKKRALEGPMVERRQKRMIKNRESAARSRSRKQAYTVELETEVDNLNRENSRLDEEHVRAISSHIILSLNHINPNFFDVFPEDIGGEEMSNGKVCF